MSFLGRAAGFLGNQGSKFLASDSGKQMLRNGVSQLGTAFPGLGNTMNKIDTGAQKAMAKYGRPISQVLDHGHKFISDMSQPGASFRDIMKNTADKALGYIRDPGGNLMHENDAQQLGYESKPSRYGGRVIANPSEDMYQDAEMAGQPHQQAPLSRREARQGRRAARRQRWRENGTWGKVGRGLLGGISMLGGGVA